MKAERYSFKQFNRQFPDDAACLDYIFDQRHPEGGKCPVCAKVDTFYRVETRRCYSCADCGHQIYPCEGTIFHKSSTSLRTWFHVMFLMTAAKNGVSAREIERQTGVTYKTAWRMAQQVRKLMSAEGTLIGSLGSVVEADETYIGGTRRMSCKMENKTPVVGTVERKGEIRAEVVPHVDKKRLTEVLVKNVDASAYLITDELRAYIGPAKNYAGHSVINHSHREYRRGGIHTNTIEGFWSQLKRSIKGTHHSVSRKHLQSYVNEFAFRYNRRASVTSAPIFPKLVSRVGEQRD